jgi:integrase
VFTVPSSIAKQKKTQVLPLTKDVREICDRRRAELGPDVDVPSAFIFGRRPSGEDFRGAHAIQDRWAAATKAAGVVDLHFHDLRGEAASRLFESGAPLTTVQAFLGHSTLIMTQRYLRLRVGALDQAIEQLEAYISRGVEKADAAGGI